MKFHDIKIFRADDWTGCQPSVIRDGVLEVWAPKGISEEDVYIQIEKKRNSIEKHVRAIDTGKDGPERPKLTSDEIRKLAEDAVKVIPERVHIYAKKLGVTYNKIFIRNQRKMWGSCSEAGNLNFNCLLMLAPLEAIDSVVVHELCHRKHMDHSPAFYEEVIKVFPDYYKWQDWLKENIPKLRGPMSPSDYLLDIWRAE